MLQQNKHKLSQPLCSSLVPHDTSGSEVGGNRCRQSFRATRTSSWMLECIVKCIQCQRKLPKHAKTCHRNVHACPFASLETSILDPQQKLTELWSAC